MKNKLLKAGIILAVLAVAVLVMAGAGAAEKTVTTCSELKDAFDSGEEYIVLGKDIVWTMDDKTLTVQNLRTQTLDLNGYNINLHEGLKFMEVEPYGTFILKGNGKIDGNKTYDESGGVINICSNGTFIMEEGTIRDASSNMGGAVYVADCGEFIMNGGEITGCYGVSGHGGDGGAVFINGTGKFTMNGGKITSCYVLDGEGGAVFLQGEGQIIMKPGSTISDCYANSATNGHGGAIMVSGGGTLYTEGGTISGCYSKGAGGAIFIEDNSRADLSNLTIDGCTSKNGGAIYVDDDQNASLQMTNCTIKNCSANNGGGIYADEKVNITLTSCIISGCTASEHGGSVLYVNENSQSTLTDCLINECSSKKDGGAIYVDNKGTCTISYTTIYSCKADQDGGAIYLNDKGTCTVSSTIIKDCHANHDGGAVFLDDNDTSFTMKDSSSITNCSAGKRAGALHISDKGICDITDSTITGCSCDVDGGAFYVNSNGTCTISDTTISSCHAKQDGGAIYLNDNGKCTITRITIEDCYANRDGGAVYIDDNNTSVTMKDSTITGCDAQKGGGVHINDKGSFTMTDSTISGCTATKNGGGVYVSKNGTFTMNGGEIYNCDPDAVYIDGKGSYNSSQTAASASAAAETVSSEEITDSLGDEVSESADGKAVINSGIIRGTVTDNGELEIVADTEIDEVILEIDEVIPPVGNKVILTDLTDSADVGIKFSNLESINNPNILHNFITNLKFYILENKNYFKEYIRKNIITCNNSGYKFDWDENDGGKPTLVDENGKKVVEQAVVNKSGIATFTENSMVSTVLFDKPVSGDVSYIYGIGDAEAKLTDYQVLGGFRIALTSDQNLPGTITFKAESSYPAGVKLMHYKNNCWEELQTKYQSGNTYTAVTNSFSPFAIVQYAKPSSSSVTSFFGKKDGSDFTFEKAVVITKATLPGATYATVTNTSGSGWYNCNLTTDSISGNGILYFQVPLDVISVKGWTVNDVSVLGCKTTYLTSEGGYAKYSAVITGAGAYTIDFEKDAATAAVEKVQEVVEQKQTATEQKQAAAEKVQETVEQKQTAVEQKQTAAKSPFPILGILAGLGIAGVLVMRRR